MPFPTAGRSRCTASCERQRVVVRVVDNGTGIPAEIRERIFDPFFTTKAVGKGTGLGLDIVRRLVRHNDGEIDVETRRAEQNSASSCRWPTSTGGGTREQARPPRCRRRPAGARRGATRPALAVPGDYTVISAASGEEALATIRELKSARRRAGNYHQRSAHARIAGAECSRRSRDVYPLARRVLLTAYSDIDAAINAINVAHLDHYLSKPWDPPEECLFPVIDDLLDGWQADYLPEAKGLRLVGHQWSPRSHAIKDFLAGNLIPYRWLDVARDADTSALLEAAASA